MAEKKFARYAMENPEVFMYPHELKTRKGELHKAAQRGPVGTLVAIGGADVRNAVEAERRRQRKW